MRYGVCEHCGDTYKLPENLKEGEKYTCLRCFKEYTLKIVRMDEFVYERLIHTKM